MRKPPQQVPYQIDRECQRNPIEMRVIDPFTGNMIACEYRGEHEPRNDGELVYKLYSPFFGNGLSMNSFRWVPAKNTLKLGFAPSREDLEKFARTNAGPKEDESE